eukprot:NODE_2168_length_1493_cov_85.086131_g2060_i0.p1 GENE.NODE_2168_length_1493_cov_85.086131_g2060_i0~~NODE_2168_length_1493_cov_85.086131_g2060_i0.p1  ORF type:complete len:462 (+),score=118.28 NODE_2168_length_1493_cov_85.086131_g2060_i0:65-1387(+)
MPGKDRSRRKYGKKHNPLASDIAQSQYAKGLKKPAADDVDEVEDGFVPEDLSEKIFKTSRHLQKEVNEDDDEGDEAMGEDKEELDDEDATTELEYSDTQSVRSVFTDNISMPDIDALLNPEDERILMQMMPNSAVQERNLADLIMYKIRQKEQADAGEGLSDEEKEPEKKGHAIEFDPKVARVYRSVGRVLSSYKSGKIPRALKILPGLNNWEELLLLTHPHTWTPHAMYAATRIFTSALNEKMAQRFFNSVLLPSVRAWMKENKALSPYLFMSIKKAMFKQKAWIKGFLLPLCEDQNCSLREALTVGSILAKSNIKVLHASVAMAKIALMPYSGACSLFLRVFLDKCYRLPLGCIDAICQHYGMFLKEKNPELPVLWHQGLLTFLQRYKDDLLPEQILMLNKVANKHSHYLITSEIRREMMPLLNRINNKKQLSRRADE